MTPLPPLRVALGVLRLLLTVAVVVVGGAVVLALALVPVRVRGARLSAWAATGMARHGAALFGLRIRCPWAERLRAHRGFVFPNHLSFADPVVLLALSPVRFLSNHVVRWVPFVGWVAGAIGTVFVNRGRRASRAEARRELAALLAARPSPPLALFPEGKIGAGGRLEPLRLGAFELAVEGAVPYLLCALRYERPEVVRWRKGEPFLRALWRLASTPRRHAVEVAFVGAVHPEPGDDPQALLHEAEGRLNAAAFDVPIGVAAGR